MPIRPLRPLWTPLVLLALAAPLPTVAAPAPPQKVILQHAVPGDILKFTHWDQGAALPEGVTEVHARPGDNALYVEATPDGFSRVKAIVKRLDIAPRQVEIKSEFIYARAADVRASGVEFVGVPSPGSQPIIQIASGPKVDQLLAALTKQGSPNGSVVASPRITTTNTIPASLSQVITDPDGSMVRQIGFSITPRINSDNTVTLALHPTLSYRVPGAVNPDGNPVVQTYELATLHTVRSGTSMAFVLATAGTGPTATDLLFFATPTILPAEGESPQPAR